MAKIRESLEAIQNLSFPSVCSAQQTTTLGGRAVERFLFNFLFFIFWNGHSSLRMCPPFSDMTSPAAPFRLEECCSLLGSDIRVIGRLGQFSCPGGYGVAVSRNPTDGALGLKMATPAFLSPFLSGQLLSTAFFLRLSFFSVP